VIAREGRGQRIGKEVEPRRSLGEAIGLYKIGEGLIAELIRIYDDLERRGEFNHFYEKGFQVMCEQGWRDDWCFGISLTKHLLWAEIDTLKDFEYALREVAPKFCP
jgi:choline kinase